MKIIITATLVLFAFGAFAQESQSKCSDESERAQRALKWFLELDQSSYRKIRERLDLEGIPVEQLRSVDDSNDCEALSTYADKMNDWNVDLSQNNKYYYRTDEFYFILYLKKQIGTGYTPLVVFDKQLKLLEQVRI